MQLFYIVIICFVGLSQGFEDENPLLQALTESQIGRATACGANGTFSGARCLSKTHFIYADDPPTATPFECEGGKVCVDLPGICFIGVTPVCPNILPLDPANLNCSVCSATPSYGCVSQTHFAACSGGQPMTEYARQCGPGFFCKIDPTGQDAPCATGATTTTADCSNTVVPLSACTTAGLFPAPGDTTCKRYYSCYAGTNGQLVQTSYSCSGTLLFNPTTQRCVAATAYTCPY